MIRPQYTQQKLNRDLIKIDDGALRERLSRVTPLILKSGELFDFALPDLRSAAYTWEPQGLVAVPDERYYYEVMRTTTQHSCGYHAFFKPSIAEVLAQMPDDPTITAFYLDSTSVVVLHDGEGHLCNCHWLSNISRGHEV